MVRRGSGYRGYAVAAAVVLVAAAAARMLTLPLPPALLVLEALICAAVLGFAIASRHLNRIAWSGQGLLLVVYMLCPALIASLGLRLAATQIPNYTMVATLFFAAVLLSVDVAAPRIAIFLASTAVILVFVELWLATVVVDPAQVGSLVLAVALLVGLQLVLLSQGERARRHTDIDAMRGHVFAMLGQKVGSTGDVSAVVAAVLAACQELFPRTTEGEIFLFDDNDGLLKPPGTLTSTAGVTAEPPALELRPGEGLAGTAFAAERALLWETALAVSTAQATMRETNRVRMREMSSAFARSAIAAPMQPLGARRIGVIVLASHRREHAWSAEDLPVLEALAVEAGRVIERARRHQAAVDEALLDSVTGLVSQRQLFGIVDKEVARAARAKDSMAIIFSDIDELKKINERRGHETGNAVLRMYADVLRATLRREDSAARFGGDEFICVLPGADRAQGIAVAERIRERLHEVTASASDLGGLDASVSVGMALFPDDAETASDLLAVAEAELIRAKQRPDHADSQDIPGRPRLWSERS